MVAYRSTERFVCLQLSEVTVQSIWEAQLSQRETLRPFARPPLRLELAALFVTAVASSSPIFSP